MELADPPMRRRHASGIETVVYRGTDLDEACEGARAVAADGDHTLMVALFAPVFDAGRLVRRLKRDVEVPTQVCSSTAGGIGPSGYLDDCIVFLFFPASRFEALATVVPEISVEGLERGSAIASKLHERFDRQVRDRRPCEHDRGSMFALTFIDGLSNCEEAIVAAVQRGMPNLPLVGGSAGDGLSFEKTHVSLDGTVHADGAVLCLIWTRLPFAVFKSDHYRTTDVRLVVTGCDPERRLVTELNGISAAVEYASVLGLDPETLTPFSFASHPLAVRVGGEHYCRSIRQLEPEGLAFFCAIDEGVVLTIAEAADMIDTMEDEFGRVSEEVGGIDLVLGFDCILRRIEAEERQLLRRVAGIFREYNVFGCTTYGEQFGAMHINQTLSGIAFGKDCEERERPGADRKLEVVPA